MAFAFAFFLPSTGYCASASLDGTLLSAFWTVPFAGLLLSIALWPLISPSFWSDHYGKITAFWSLTFLVPLFARFGLHITIEEVLNIVLITYVPFIILLTALFTVTGGIYLKGTLVGSPLVNTFILFLGATLASWMGTTGASMLLIRPLLRANIYRTHRVHTVIFFIILVGNIGGSLTPLGDPPLFLGFLNGMSFFWPTKNMLGPMLFIGSILLAMHFVIDTILFNREDKPKQMDELREKAKHEKLQLVGWKLNFPLLAGVAISVLISGIWEPGINLKIYGSLEIGLQDIMRDIALLAIIVLSGRYTNKKIREKNAFTWDPMRQVAKLFLGIFICLVPMIAILQAGTEGAFSFLIELLNTDGKPNNVIYFWVTGLLSTFLDNAPTFLVFFNIAGGDAEVLMTTMSATFLAITTGTVFMGANTYISNAPNLMIKALAEGMGVRMPSFFAYMAIVMVLLFPLFVIMNYIFL